MAGVEAILFDLDGVLRDSTRSILPAAKHALHVHGMEHISEDDIRPYIHGIEVVYENLASHLDFDSVMAAYDKKLKELYHTIELYEGAADLIESLKQKGYRLAVVSSARRAHTYLQSIGQYLVFDVVVGGHDVSRKKPHPEPVLKALGALKAKPENSVMVGDLVADITAAKEAGVRTSIGITHGYGTYEELAGAGADYVVDTFAEIEEIIDKM